MLNNNLGLKANFQPDRRVPVIREASTGFGVLSQELFLKMLCLERKRMERSGRRFVLMLLDPGRLLRMSGGKEPVLPRLQRILTQSVRDTDVMGWYKENSILGVIFTEVGGEEEKLVVRTLSAKVTDALYDALSIDEINEIKLSFHVFPEDWEDEEKDDPTTASLQVVLAHGSSERRTALHLKRLLDIAGSLAAIVMCLPVFLVIAIAIKLTSRGPVLFRQVRLRQYGKKFNFLKFRSMYVNNDHSIHEEYVKKLISGATDGEQPGSQPKVFKLTADPRITPIGRFLRQTSLDEIPQFFNVLMGDMSLVGPRPPVCYEYAHYDLWHKQRLLAVKPGITGLWQIEGRSRVKFDDMVRMDIRYARMWTLWLDIKILLRTPGAVVSGNGAC